MSTRVSRKLYSRSGLEPATSKPRKRKKSAPPLENYVKKAILQWLKLNKIAAWRQNTGAMSGEHKGKKYFIKFGIPGAADITGIMPDGRRLEIETKREGCYQTDDQKAFEAMIRSNGGVYILAHSLDEFLAALEENS